MKWRHKVYPTVADVGAVRRSRAFAWWPRRCTDGQTRWLEYVTQVEHCYLRTPLIHGLSWELLVELRYPEWGVLGYEPLGYDHGVQPAKSWPFPDPPPPPPEDSDTGRAP